MKDHRTMLTRWFDIHASVDLTRLVQTAGITIEERAALAGAAIPAGDRGP